MATAQQLAGIHETMKSMLKLMTDATPIIQATTKSMDDLGESAKKSSKEIKETKSWLGKFIGDAESGFLRKQKGGIGFMHRMLYGVSGYFILKNRVDGLLSGLDKFVVRPLSGLKGEDGKQGLIGKMFFGIGGSYRKTKNQLSSVMSVVQDEVFQGPKAPRTSALQMSKSSKLGSARSLMKQALMQKIVSNKAVRFFNKQKKGEKFVAWLGVKGKSLGKIAMSSLKVLGIMGLTVMKYFIIIGLALLGVALIVKGLKKMGLDGKKLKEIGLKMWAAMKVGFGIIWDSLIRIWDGASQMLNGIFGDGDLTDVLEGWFKIVSGAIGVLLGVAVALVWPLLVGIWEIAKTVFWKIVNWAMGKYEERAAEIYDKFMWVVTAIGAIMVFLGVVFASILGWPVVIGGFIMLLIGSILEQINPFAAGGVTKSGMSLVGEKGPELVRLPKGSRVHSNTESKQMLSTGGGNNITVNVQGRIGASDSELRQIAQKVGQMINKEINRTTSSRGLGA